ncbi:MAG: hypothetical protein K0U67_00070 [Actinomycetia bacterium]|nr:hypothetical protein [Actinomycetes bacterium]
MNPRTAEIAAVAQVVGSVGMFGVIWIVQIVHYPLMRFISGQQFARFESEHRTRISRVVGPLMAVEGVCVLAFFFAPPAGLPWWLPWAGAGAEAIAIGTTVFVSAPLHGRLDAHFDPATLDRLIATNWIRTAAWTGRAALAIAILVAVLR